MDITPELPQPSPSVEVRSAGNRISEIREGLSERQKVLYERLQPILRSSLLAGVMLFQLSGSSHLQTDLDIFQGPASGEQLGGVDRVPDEFSAHRLILPSTVHKDAPVGYPQELMGPPVFTMCHEGESTYEADRRIKENPEENPIITLYKGNLEAIQNSDIEPEMIRGEYGQAEIDSDGFVKKGNMNVLLIPVGYDEPELRMQEQIKNLKIAFKNVNIHFSYLNQSMPVTINVHGGWVRDINPEEVKIILNKINLATGKYYDKSAVLINSKDDWGSTAFYNGGPYIIDANYGNPTSIHEIGHLAGLDDRYFANFSEADLLWSTEFTVNPLTYEARTIWEPVAEKPPIYPTGATCNGKSVFSYYPYDQDNIMNESHIDKETFAKDIVEEKDFFNPVQISRMNKHIADLSSERKFKSPIWASRISETKRE